MILDDLKGRKEARKFGFRITGTLGILYKAKQTGKITEVLPYMQKLKDNGFRVSERIEKEILNRSNE
ncbi:MAG: DUF3368 domain-containing protein [Bacteroidota bacterium]